MTMRKVPLDQPERDPVAGTAALVLAADLSCECWLLAGFDPPSYSRAETPVRFVPR